MSRALEQLFPALAALSYQVTSPAQVDYNCIAWAAGDASRWFWPDEFDQYYWPEKAPRRATLEAFAEAFRTLGFEVCNDATFEAGWERVAVYASENGAPTDAARQLPDGRWTSKLGGLEDITHANVDHVSGTVYGKPVLFLRRSAPTRAETLR